MNANYDTGTSYEEVHGTSAQMINTNNTKEVGDEKQERERDQILYPGF